MADTQNSSDRSSALRLIFKIARRMVGSARQRRRVMAGAALEALGIALGVSGPLALKTLIDGLGSGALGGFQVILCVAGFAFSWFGATICSSARIVYSTRIIDEVTGGLAEEALRTALPEAATAREADSGRTLGLIERLPFSLYIVADGLIWRAVPLVVQVVATAAVMAALVPLRYLVALSLVLGAYVLTTRIGAKHHSEVSAEANTAMGQVSQNNGDILRNARRVVFNGALDWEMGRVARQYYDRGKITQKVTASLVGLSAVQYGTLSLGLFGLLLLAGYDVSRHVLTVGDLVLVQSFALRLVVPLGGFAFVVSQASTALANLREVLNLANEVDDAPGPIRTATGAGAVELDDVHFTYGPGLPGLTGITTVIRPGSLTAIVGPNGSGKSTLAQLIAGILQPSAGAVRIDGVPLSAVPPRARHQWLLYVPQFIGLFNRSLGSNITYPQTGFSVEELADILTRWRFTEEGRELDFDAIVGEQGERLSGGQLQKLELARVSGVYVPVMILDESTSALDPASEQTVVAELVNRFGGNRTIIMITHHESLADMADKVLFVKDGKLFRQGRHAALLADSAAYRRLWG